MDTSKGYLQQESIVVKVQIHVKRCGSSNLTPIHVYIHSGCVHTGTFHRHTTGVVVFIHPRKHAKNKRFPLLLVWNLVLHNPVRLLSNVSTGLDLAASPCIFTCTCRCMKVEERSICN